MRGFKKIAVGIATLISFNVISIGCFAMKKGNTGKNFISKNEKQEKNNGKKRNHKLSSVLFCLDDDDNNSEEEYNFFGVKQNENVLLGKKIKPEKQEESSLLSDSDEEDDCKEISKQENNKTFNYSYVSDEEDDIESLDNDKDKMFGYDLKDICNNGKNSIINPCQHLIFNKNNIVNPIKNINQLGKNNFNLFRYGNYNNNSNKFNLFSLNNMKLINYKNNDENNNENINNIVSDRKIVSEEKSGDDVIKNNDETISSKTEQLVKLNDDEKNDLEKDKNNKFNETEINIIRYLLNNYLIQGLTNEKISEVLRENPNTRLLKFLRVNLKKSNLLNEDKPIYGLCVFFDDKLDFNKKEEIRSVIRCFFEGYKDENGFWKNGFFYETLEKIYEDLKKELLDKDREGLKNFLKIKDNKGYQKKLDENINSLKEKLKAFDSSDSFIKNFKDLVNFNYALYGGRNMEFVEDEVFFYLAKDYFYPDEDKNSICVELEAKNSKLGEYVYNIFSNFNKKYNIKTKSGKKIVGGLGYVFTKQRKYVFEQVVKYLNKPIDFKDERIKNLLKYLNRNAQFKKDVIDKSCLKNIFLNLRTRLNTEKGEKEYFKHWKEKAKYNVEILKNE